MKTASSISDFLHALSKFQPGTTPEISVLNPDPFGYESVMICFDQDPKKRQSPQIITSLFFFVGSVLYNIQYIKFLVPLLVVEIG